MAKRKDLGWITCDTHGKQKAYFVCKHIKQAEDIKFKSEWTKERGADLICSIPGPEHAIDDLVLICEAHLREMGLIPAA